MSSNLKLVTPGLEVEPTERPLDGSGDSVIGGEVPRGNDRRNPERTVLGRIASIMEAFDGSQQVLGLGDLSERTGLPKSTLHRLGDQLCQVGWMARDSGGYRLGMRMFELGSLAIEENSLHEAALPHLQALAAKSGMSVHLAILDRAEIVQLEKVTNGPLRLSAREEVASPHTALHSARRSRRTTTMLSAPSCRRRCDPGPRTPSPSPLLSAPNSVEFARPELHSTEVNCTTRSCALRLRSVGPATHSVPYR